MRRVSLFAHIAVCLCLMPLAASAQYLPDEQRPMAWLLEQARQAPDREGQLRGYRLAARLWANSAAQCRADGVQDGFFDQAMSLLLNSNASVAEQWEALEMWHTRRRQRLSEALGDYCLLPQRNVSKQLQQLAPGQAVLHVLLLEDRVELLFADHQQRQRRQSPVPAQRVRQIAARYRRAISAGRSSAGRYGELLSQWLLQPVVPLLRSDYQSLQLFVDDALLELPWAALPVASAAAAKLLGEWQPLVIGIGLSSLNAADNARDRQVLFGALASAEGLDRDMFPALPGVKREWQAVQQLSGSRALLDAEFSRSGLEKLLDARDFSILHLASHAQIADAKNSFVLLGDGALNLSSLGDLVRQRRYAIQPLRLVALSACETAQKFDDDSNAVQSHSLGLAGIALQAGARNALASLWPVDDTASSVLMEQFYREIDAHAELTLAQALQRARQSTRALGYSEPWHWAAFQLYGNGQ